MARSLALGERLITFVSLATILAFGGGAKSCSKENAAKPIPGRGEITVVLLEREHADTPEKDLKDSSGLLHLVYDLENSGSHTSNDTTRSFTGAIKVPVAVLVDKSSMVLTRFEVLDNNRTEYLALAGQSVDDLKSKANQGATVTVIVTRDHGTPTEVRITSNATPPPGDGPRKEFTSIKRVYPNPTDVLTADVKDALPKLKSIASATRAYHDELLKLVSEAKELDLAHLNLLVDACYFTLAETTAMNARYRELMQKDDPAFKPEMLALAVKIRTASEFSNYTNWLVNLGMAKVTDLTLDGATALLNKLFPIGGASDAFNTVIKTYSPLTADQKLSLMDLAISKAESWVAVNLAVDWFTKDSDKTVATLLDLGKKFSGADSRDPLYIRASAALESVTDDEAKALVSATGYASNKKTVALGLMPKVKNLSGYKLAAILGLISDADYRDPAVREAIQLLPSLTTDELKAVMNVTGYPSNRKNVMVFLAPRVTDLTGHNLAAVAALINDADYRDPGVFEAIKSIKTLSAAEARAIVAAVGYPSNRKTAILTLASRVSDLNAANLVSLVGLLSDADYRDPTINEAIKLLPALTSSEAAQLVAATGYHSNKRTVALALAPKLVDLTGPNYSQVVASISDTDYRDPAIAGVLQYFVKPTSVDAKALVDRTGYPSNKKDVVLRLAPRITDLTGASLVEIVTSIGDADYRDPAINGAVASLKSVTSGEAKVLVDRTGYHSNKRTVTLALVSKVSDLTGMTLAQIVSSITDADYRDPAIQGAIATLKTLTGAEAKTLVAATGYPSNKKTVALALMPRITDFTVANAVAIADIISSDYRDAYLLQAVDSVIDLSAGNLLDLANRASYQQNKDEIVRRGLKRLSGGH